MRGNGGRRTKFASGSGSLFRHLANDQPHERGWFYHFVERHTGERAWKSELSTIDTALLLAGVLTAQQYFASDGEIVRMAQEIYERVDFAWMLDPRHALPAHGMEAGDRLPARDLGRVPRERDPLPARHRSPRCMRSPCAPGMRLPATRWSSTAIGSWAPDRFLLTSSRTRGWISGDSAMVRRLNWITSRTR